ncbi:MAG: NUDIX domain-containing protein [Spirochaetales bacterium]|nr:NUDIX domain-containing protein [Spirochaetales bacterium]
MKNNFKYCPNCGSNNFKIENNRFECENCRFVLFNNTAAAVAVFIKFEDKFIITKRGRNPQKGMLDLPGGFVDPGESAEEAVAREIYEELGIEIKNTRYLFSYPNKYPYKNVLYNTCDMFFYGEALEIPAKIQREEIEGIILMNIDEIKIEDIGFNSIKNAVSKFKKIIK